MSKYLSRRQLWSYLLEPSIQVFDDQVRELFYLSPSDPLPDVLVSCAEHYTIVSYWLPESQISNLPDNLRKEVCAIMAAKDLLSSRI